MLDRQTGRIGYIDGIRGIASLLVVLCHLSCVFFPGFYFDGKATTYFEKIWLNTPLNVLTNGNAAVQCFFVLSGFLITRRIYLTNSAKLTPISEYKKLLRIVLPGVLFAALLMSFGLMFHLQASSMDSTLYFVNEYNNFTPTIKSVFMDVIFRTFVEGSIYVGPFWTIKFEFLGAIIIATFAYYLRNKKNSKAFYVITGFLLLSISPNIVSFVVGAFFCDCIRKEDVDDTLVGRFVKKVMNNKFIMFLLSILGLYLFSVNMTITGIWKPIQYIPIIKYYPELLRAVGVGSLLIVTYKTTVLQRLLSIRPLAWLGKISAYTYAFHWPLTLSAGCGIFLLLYNYLNYQFAALIASAVVIITTLLLAYTYTKALPIIIKAENKLLKIIIPARFYNTNQIAL